jgi:hypothetical protein
MAVKWTPAPKAFRPAKPKPPCAGGCEDKKPSKKPVKKDGEK